MSDFNIYDTIIIGGGPAGMSALIYAKRARLSCILIEKASNGGQVLNTYEVDNYPGLPGISGMELSQKFSDHCVKLGGEIKSENVVGISVNDDIKIVYTEKGEYHCKTIIIATGARYAKLNVPGESDLAGAGVSYCATCDGAFFRNRTVAVVGGGDVAVEDAIFLARGCSKVYVIHRRNELRAARSLQAALFELPNVEMVWNCTVEEINGADGFVDGITIKDVQTENITKLKVDGVFVAVGILPNSTEFSGKVTLDAKGYIEAGENCETSLPGVFAVGDVRSKQLRQIVTAVADGANAITSVERYLISNR